MQFRVKLIRSEMITYVE